MYLFFPVLFTYFFYFIILYWFCHTLTWICHGCTCVPHPEPPLHLTPHPIPLGHPSAPALSTLSHASNLDWWSVSCMIIYMFKGYSLRSSHPRLFPQSPKDCSIHLCLFCCLAYRVIITIFLNSIYALVCCIGIFLSQVGLWHISRNMILRSLLLIQLNTHTFVSNLEVLIG